MLRAHALTLTSNKRQDAKFLSFQSALEQLIVPDGAHIRGRRMHASRMLQLMRDGVWYPSTEAPDCWTQDVTVCYLLPAKTM